MCFKQRVAAYTFGEKRQVKVLRANKGAYNNGFHYAELDGASRGYVCVWGKEWALRHADSAFKLSELPQKGDIVFIYQDKDHKYWPMPDVERIKRIYSLTTKTFK